MAHAVRTEIWETRGLSMTVEIDETAARVSVTPADGTETIQAPLTREEGYTWYSTTDIGRAVGNAISRMTEIVKTVHTGPVVGCSADHGVPLVPGQTIYCIGSSRYHSRSCAERNAPTHNQERN